MEKTLKFKLLNKNAQLPTYADDKAVGLDLYSSDFYTIYPGNQVLVKTGVSVELYEGVYMRIAPRSGLAYKFGIDVMAGVIDPGYTGDIGVILRNFGDDIFHISPGDRIAQGVIEQADRVIPVIADELSETTRGSGGFGSTGV